MAITKADLGQGSSGSAVQLLNVTASGATATNFAAVFVITGSVASAMGCTDNGAAGGSSYTVLGPFLFSGSSLAMWLCWTGSLAASVTTITPAWTGATGVAVTAAQFTGIAASPRDATGDSSLATGSGATTATATTGTLAQSDELVLGYLALSNPPVTVNYNTWGSIIRATGSLDLILAGWIETSSTSTTWTPSWTNGEDFGLKLFAFKAAGGGGAVSHQLLTLGVG